MRFHVYFRVTNFRSSRLFFKAPPGAALLYSLIAPVLSPARCAPLLFYFLEALRNSTELQPRNVHRPRQVRNEWANFSSTMVKSTYQPSPNLASQSALPPGWSQHAAPTGHTYYYNAETKESTYRRPGATPSTEPLPAPQPLPQLQLSDPRVAMPSWLSRTRCLIPAVVEATAQDGVLVVAGEVVASIVPRPQPADKPRSKAAIPAASRGFSFIQSTAGDSSTTRRRMRATGGSRTN